MSSVSKAGTSRIPTFGSRLPQPLPKPPSTSELSKQHIGKLVRVADKEGLLRFIGNVHFASGIWCGIELPLPIGKNDGSVQGVRYFPCSASHGVMAPLAKTTLADRGSCESLDDDVSGPYSILFIDGQINKTASRQTDRVTQPKDCTQTIRTPTTPTRHQEIGNLPETITKENVRNQTLTKKSEHNSTVTRISHTNELTKTLDGSSLVANGTYDVETNNTYDIEQSHAQVVCDLNNTITNNPSLHITPTNSTENIDDDNKENNCQRVPLNRSYENLLNDSTFEVKRRRTSTKDTSTSSGSYSEDRRSLLLHLSKLTSTPSRSDVPDYFLRQLRLSSIANCPDKPQTSYEELNSKRNSLEREENSLGILTPDQIEFQNFPDTRSPSLEYELNLLDNKSEVQSPRDDSLGLLSLKEDIPSQLISLMDCNTDDSVAKIMSSKKLKETTFGSFMEPRSSTNSIAEPSLGLLDEHLIVNLSTPAEVSNMKLLFNNKSADILSRLEETPSPEELPFDPTPIVETDTKVEPSKSKTVSSFVTSITSITSLDTGYQGDGEMSRPASRGAENSPLTRRPIPRPQTRRPDPMTDSDFYTESDADVQEENPLRGDRRAQVIDGTLYGVDPQAAADIYVNNRENMDSSGIFTDLENNPRTEEDSNPIEPPDVSPSDSTKTISVNSQSNIMEILDRTVEKKTSEKDVQKENPKKRIATSPVTASPTSRYGSKGVESGQKYKIPKREVVSKVKVALETVPLPKVIKKPVNKWDAVMNKISKSEQTKTNLKEVKSKVFSEIQISSVPKPRPIDSNRNSPRPAASPKIPNNKFTLPTDRYSPSRPPSIKNGSTSATPIKRPGSARSTSSNEKRRVRPRPGSGNVVKSVAGSNVGSSIHSSISDLSAATVPQIKPKGAAKKRSDVVQVTQVLTANKLPVRTQQQTNNVENKKNTTNRLPSPAVNSKTKRPLFPPKEKKPTTNKECGRVTTKGGRISPSVRPPLAQVRVPVKLEKPPVAEALAILVHHLVFNVEAFQVPSLRKQVQRYRSEIEENIKALRSLEETLIQEKVQHAREIEEERKKYQNNISRLIENHRIQIEELNNRLEHQQCLLTENECDKDDLCKEQEQQLLTLKKEFEKLQRTQKESIDILREENEAIRDKIDEKQLEIDTLRHESKKLKNDYESREMQLKDLNSKLREKLLKSESDLDEKFKELIEENQRYREENNRLLSYGDDKGISVQEVQSLRVVLEMKQNEIGKLRKSLAEATQRANILEGAEEKARVLQARCEDLEHQLQRKSEFEKSLLMEKQKLQDSFREETNQKKRIQQFNEELQWKLKQNKEVITKVLNQSDEGTFNRSILSSSLNERHGASRLTLERTLSFRDKARSYTEERRRPSTDFEDDQSPPGSPKVKGVVEKSESVSYVLDLDDSPDVVASRIVRRSFRTTTPSKNTPTKSPLNKRPRMRNPLSQSASTSAILTSSKMDLERPQSASTRSDEGCTTSTPENYHPHHSSCPQNDISWHLCSWRSTSTPKHEYSSSPSSLKYNSHLHLDEDNEDDIQLPALPSEENGAPTLPSPKHLAGEAMLSESQSEDESTSSSQL